MLKVSLATYHLLASIVAAFSGLVGHFNRLRVEDARSGGFFFRVWPEPYPGRHH